MTATRLTNRQRGALAPE